MNRLDVTEQIVTAKMKKGIKWADVAKTLGKSKEWTTAGLLGQMTFTREQAEIVGKTFELSAESVQLLQVVPYKGSLRPDRPADLSLL